MDGSNLTPDNPGRHPQGRVLLFAIRDGQAVKMADLPGGEAAQGIVFTADNNYILVQFNVGENTDGKGFLTALSAIADPAGKAFVLFGAGGAARAIAVETALAGAASITIVNRDPARGSELVALLNEKTRTRAQLVVWDRTYRVPAASDIIVNATSIGLFPHVEGRLDLDLDSLRPGLIVADVIPNPPRTQLIRDAEARGCIVLDGLGMLVSQGAISIRHWTGIDPEPKIMRKKLEDIFGL
jgi:shikimate dehydrogenase